MRFPLTSELALMIEERIHSIGRERPIRDKHAHEIATRHNALPLFRGVKGYYALGLTGEMLKFQWSRFDTPVPMFSRGRAYGALMIGITKYPELAVLSPERQPGDTECEHCRGSGLHPLREETGDERILCECGGLGFIPSRWPDGEAAPAPYKGSVFPDITPSRVQATYVYHLDADYDVQSDEELNGLLNTMLDDPEHDFVYYRPKDRAGNARIDSAIHHKIVVEGEVEFFHYRRAPGDRNFVHLERNVTEDSGAEYLFGYEKRDLLWYRDVTSGEMYVRSKLRLSDRARKEAEAERQKDRNPFDAKPGAFGFSVDLFKAWPYIRRWFSSLRKSRKARIRDE
jgi:hypothetical protein